jgi:putative membrane protein
MEDYMAETRWLIVVMLALLLVSGAGMAMGGGVMGPGMMWGYGAQAGAAWWPAMMLGWLGMIGFWAAVILGAVILVRWLGSSGPQGRGPEPDDALAVLRRRYAAGEIDQATYERMRRELTS